MSVDNALKVFLRSVVDVSKLIESIKVVLKASFVWGTCNVVLKKDILLNLFLGIILLLLGVLFVVGDLEWVDVAHCVPKVPCHNKRDQSLKLIMIVSVS